MGEVEYRFENKRKDASGEYLRKAVFTACLDGKPIVRVTLGSCNGELEVDSLETSSGYATSKYKYILFRKIVSRFDEINNELGKEHKKVVNEFYDKSELDAYEHLSGMHENKLLLRLTASPYVQKKETH